MIFRFHVSFLGCKRNITQFDVVHSSVSSVCPVGSAFVIPFTASFWLSGRWCGAALHIIFTYQLPKSNLRMNPSESKWKPQHHPQCHTKTLEIRSQKRNDHGAYKNKSLNKAGYFLGGQAWQLGGGPRSLLDSYKWIGWSFGRLKGSMLVPLEWWWKNVSESPKDHQLNKRM